MRAAVHVDPRTAALRIVSDPLPTILQGIPLQIRSVRVAVDRGGFMLNPTSCAERRIDASIGAVDGRRAAVGSRFQVGDCAALRYTPKLAVAVGGRGHVRAGRRTALTATLTQPAGQAASRRVKLVLPRTLNTRLDVVRNACTQATYDAGRCGAAARVGSASAATPLLRAPLQGSVYMVRTPARRLPDLVVQLRGEVAIDLVGKITIARDLRLVADFDAIPDVPLCALPAGAARRASRRSAPSRRCARRRPSARSRCRRCEATTARCSSATSASPWQAARRASGELTAARGRTAGSRRRRTGTRRRRVPASLPAVSRSHDDRWARP